MNPAGLPRSTYGLLGLGLLLAALVYLPGLSGGWLLDDQPNLGEFKLYPAGAAPYEELVLGNRSGLLGRSVAMATFAANHALDLFATPALKATNIGLHLLCGLLLYLLLARLFRLRSPLDVSWGPTLLAAAIATWWLLLPLHISTVLYIVQRMTQLATLLSLACCLAYVTGRARLQGGQRGGAPCLALALLVLLPLALLAKESAVSTLPWLLLIEIFFFRSLRVTPRTALAALTLLALAAGAWLAWQPPRFLAEGYLTRDFSMADRLLSQPRALWAYIGGTLLPDSSMMGLYHDDFEVSRHLLAPWTTLPALAGLLALLVAALVLANSARWWAVSLGLFWFLSGHLLESSVIPLELYFEHRNYQPSMGLLVAATAVLGAWRWRRAGLAVLFGLYLLLLAGATLQRSHIWGDPHVLLAVSAQNHPHSMRAWSDYAEDLLAQQRPGEAIAAVQLAAERNPRFAGISYLHLLTIACRLDATPPPAAVHAVASRIGTLDIQYSTSLTIGLDALLSLHREGHCGKADFAPLASGLMAQDQALTARLGERQSRRWLLRYTIAQWLLATGHTREARDILRDLWRHLDQSAVPPVGLALAEALPGAAHAAERNQVLDELAAVTADAPPRFREKMNTLRRPDAGAP